MATASQAVPGLLTAEEFAQSPDPGYPEELVKGRIVTPPPPGVRHGIVCIRFGRILDAYADDHDLGYAASNDSGMVTERGPDSVRGPDVSFYTYAKVPKGSPPTGYADVPPDLVAEVLSPDDRWSKVLAKVAEYLNAGVGVVLVLDPERKTVHVFDDDQPVRVLGEADELTVPGLLGEFRVVVGKFFA